MIPGHYNFETGSKQKAQNFSFGSKPPTQPMLKKLDLNWNRKLEKLLNNTDDQDDYFQIYSDVSNTSISTICINSNESRFSDSYWSDTDVTRRDDIVIELTERAFYNTKVNPFPQLKFPPTSSRVEDDQKTEDVAPTFGEGVIDVRNNEDLDPTGVSKETDDQKIENGISPDSDSNEVVDVRGIVDMALADVASNGSAQRSSNDQNNDRVASTDEIVTEVKNDQSNEVLTCDLSCDPTSNQNNEDLAAADGVESEVKSDQINGGLACSSSKDASTVQNNEDVVAASDEKDHQSNEALTCDVSSAQSNDLVAVTDDVSEVKKDQSNEALTRLTSQSGNLANEDLSAADGVGSEVKGDQINKGLACSASKEENSEDVVVADAVLSEVTDNQNINENSMNTHASANEVSNNNEDLPPPSDNVIAEGQQNDGDLAAANIDNNVIINDESPTEYDVQHVSLKLPVAESMESTNLVRIKSTSSRNKNEDEAKSTDSKPKPVASTSSKNNSALEMRKKRYRKTVDTNHRRNVKRELSKSSGCTHVTSTTTVQVTTNDNEIFDALADMPAFINSSVIDLASSYIDNRIRQEKNQRSRYIDFDSALPSSSSSITRSWRNDKLSSTYDEYISPREAYKQLNILLTDGTSENLKAVMYDEYNGIRFDDDVASSEDEFLSDVDDLNTTNANWTPPESELRRQVAIILKKIHPLENNYSTVIDDMLCKYLSYIHSKQRVAKVNRIVDVVNRPVSQQEKTELLIRGEIDDKKLNRDFYHSPMEPSDFTELGERRREAIIRKYTRCHNDRNFCYSYFQRAIDDRPVSKLGWRVAKLKRELELIFA